MQNEYLTKEDLDLNLDLTLMALDMPDGEDFGFLALRDHECDCANCTRPHCIYDTIFAEISVLPTFEAPDGFELEVMARLRDIGNGNYALEVRVWDKARGASVGTILLFLGAGSVYAFFKDAIWRGLPGKQVLKLSAAAAVAPKVAKTAKAVKVAKLAKTTKSTALATSGHLARNTKLLMGLLTVLGAIQTYFLNRRKGEGK